MKSVLKKELDYLKSEGVDYADIRIVDTETEYIATENRTVKEITNSRSKGFGVRVILDGSLGYSSSQNLELIHETAVKALEIAKASRVLQKEKIQLSKKEVVEDFYRTPIEINPFEVSLDEKIELLISSEKLMNESAKLSRTGGSLTFQKQNKIYADSEGSYIEQELYESGGGIYADATIENDKQTRSYPNSMGGNHVTGGYEYVKQFEFLANAERIAKEVEELVNADECPSGTFDVVINSDQMTLQIHESIGHPIELDRIFGSEAAFAGMSFVNVDMIEEGYKYGSEHVTIEADSTIVGALGTYGYDDDGVKSQKTTIIDKGILKNFITSRDTAVKIGQTSNATNRAEGWQNLPIVRMPSISILPGKYELEELFEGIDNGLFISTNKSWSIDDKRINFQFGAEIAYEIKSGKLTGKIYKNPIYSGITPEFWGSCDGVANEKYWTVYGTPNCGKGEPMQSAHVSHGSSPTRFRNVKVGVSDVK